MSLKRGSKVYFGPGPSLVMVLESKNHNQGGSAATWGSVVELTGHMFFSYPMGDFCVIKTWVQSILWPRTQLGDDLSDPEKSISSFKPAPVAQ